MAVWIMGAFFLLTSVMIYIKPDWIAGFSGRADEIREHPGARRLLVLISITLASVGMVLPAAYYLCTGACRLYRDLLLLLIPLVSLVPLIGLAGRLQSVLDKASGKDKNP